MTSVAIHGKSDTLLAAEVRYIENTPPNAPPERNGERVGEPKLSLPFEGQHRRP
jgi:hypothetical protein